MEQTPVTSQYETIAWQRVVQSVVALCCGLFAFAGAAHAAPRPNILYIVTDDVGLGDIRSYNANGQVALPTIEQLAQEGVRFTDAHTTAAKCAPSRYSIITGNYHWRGKQDWGQWNYKGGSQILAGQRTLGSMLQSVGYTTAIFGKHHLGAQFYRKNSNEYAPEGLADSSVDFSRPMEDGPAEHGFDYSFVAMRGIQDSPYAFFENGSLFGSVNQLINWEVGDYGDTRIVAEGIGLSDWNTRGVGPTLLQKALDFIDDHQQSQPAAPFFLMFNNQAVHGPWTPPQSIGSTPVLGMSGMTKRTDLLIEIDAILDELLTSLEGHGILEDTLIIFTSDNGGLWVPQEENAGHDVSAGYRGDKGTIYEGGHRVPLIFKWGSDGFGPWSLPQGTVRDGLVGVHDVYATLAQLLAVQIASDEAVDSHSFLPILLEQQTATRDSMIHEADAEEDNAPDGGIQGRHFGYRSGQYKLVFDNSEVVIGLYDLESDPAETVNLVDEPAQQSRIAALRAEFDAARVSTRTAPIPPVNEDPVVSITSPADGTDFNVNESVVFQGTATDAEDGALGSSIAWRSDRDGALGDGVSISVATLSLGSHTITAAVTDSGGSTAEDSISITISEPVNAAPTISIDSPADGSTALVGDTVTFDATADDAEDGALGSSVSWSSSIDGSIGSGASVSVSNLSEGSHTITASVTDSAGAAAEDSISVTIQPPANAAPTISIDSPATGSSAQQGASIEFNATANDAEDGALGASVSWSSSINGALGTGASVSVSNLSEGSHTITASVTDSAGDTSTDSISLTIEAASPPPPPPPPQASSGGGAVGTLGLLLLSLFALRRKT